MLKATPQQLQQVEDFFYVINHEMNNLLLHPVVDEKTGVERLGICVANRSTGDVYMLGLWFLPKDNLYKRFAFKLDNKIITKRPPFWVWRFICRLKKYIQLLWI